MSKLVDLGAALISASVVGLTLLSFIGWLWSALQGALQ